MKIKRITFFRAESRFRDELPDLADMLRYDSAFQWTKDPRIIAFPVFQTKAGNLGGAATAGRWDSFAIRLTPNPDKSENAPTIYNLNYSEWVSYRHPRNSTGATDYKRLVPVTLDSYRQAKDTDSISTEAI